MSSVFPEQAVQRVEAPGVSPQLLAMNHGELTKRELFAAIAMQGIFANFSDSVARKVLVDLAEGAGRKPKQQICYMAVELADALIAELAK